MMSNIYLPKSTINSLSLSLSLSSLCVVQISLLKEKPLLSQRRQKQELKRRQKSRQNPKTIPCLIQMLLVYLRDALTMQVLPDYA